MNSAQGFQMTYDLIIKNGTIVNHNGIGDGDVAIKDGKIVGVGDFKTATADKVIDAKGLHILPGVIDTQVHFREPGNEYKEDLETGANAAVLGGVTGVFEMPNTNPTTSTNAALADKIKRATGRMSCDFAFYAGATGENIDELPDLEHQLGCVGIKVFMGSSTGTLLVKDDETLGKVLSKITRRAAFHSEDEYILEQDRDKIRPGDVSSHYEARSKLAALTSTKRLVRLARQYNKRIHVLHISTAEEMEFLKDHKDLVSIEVLPNHLSFYGPDIYKKIGTLAQQNPPIREKYHNDALWVAVQNGLVDVLGSDHAPHTLEEKQRTYPASPSGTPGVQTMLPVMLTHVANGKLTLMRLVDLLCHGPNRLFGIAGKGRLAVGYDADITIVDLKARKVITNEMIASKSKWTPFNGMEAKGWPTHTIVRGQVVMNDDEIILHGKGQPMQFQENMHR